MALIRRIYAPDVAVLPIGDHFTMGPREAAVAAELVGAKRVIPSHYGTFPLLTGTPEAMREPPARRASSSSPRPRARRSPCDRARALVRRDRTEGARGRARRDGRPRRRPRARRRHRRSPRCGPLTRAGTPVVVRARSVERDRRCARPARGVRASLVTDEALLDGRSRRSDVWVEASALRRPR